MSDFLTRIAKLSPQRLALLANELNERLEALEQERCGPVAIVGMGCRYPGGASDPESLWALLRDGVDAIGEVPADRWDVDALYDPDPDRQGKMATRWGGFIEAPQCFDPKFFGVAPAEAVTMDPQQRLLLETAWEALENAGISPASLAGSATGVFVGICNFDYAFHTLRAPREEITPYFASGLSHAVASGRISYLLGLQGPSLTVDTSCSASLMAVHLACQSLRRGESDLALAGGANLILNPETTIALSRSRMMAPDGRCKAFSDAADGFVRAEGSGIVVLRRLRDAVADGYRILATIRGTAANQDGKSSGLTAPNGPSQEAVLRAALADAGMGVDDLQYVEAHGTGTALGDPIEVGALAQVFSERSQQAGPLWLGSIKSNMGHLESAAGIAGLMKLVLALQHREIPATLHAEVPNRRVEWKSLPLRLATRRQDWPQAEGPRAGGVSSFGFSGTNVHVIVQEAPAMEAEPQFKGLPHLVVLSAKTGSALRQLATLMADSIEAHPELGLSAVARTLMAGRSHFDHRIALVASSCKEVISKLRDGKLAAGKLEEHRPRLGFVFAPAISCDASLPAMVDHIPVFREKLRECEALVSAEAEGPPEGWLESWLRDARAPIPDVLRPVANLAVQYAFAELLQSCDLAPTLVSGSGIGAVAAACCAGALAIEDALRLTLAAGRGQIDEVRQLSQTVPMQMGSRPWFCADAGALLEPWLRRAMAMGAALPAEEQERESDALWVLIGDPATEKNLPRRHVVVSAQGADGVHAFVRAAAKLYAAGCSPNLSRLYGDTAIRPVALPAYPFERQRYWLDLAPISPPERAGKPAAGARREEAQEDRSGDWLYEVAWEPRPRKSFSEEEISIDLEPVLEEFVAAPPSETVLRVGEATARLQAVCGGYAYRALAELGLGRRQGETFSLEELCERLHVAPERTRIAGRLIAILVEDGIVERIGKRFRVDEGAVPVDPEKGLAALEVEYPEIGTELKVLKRCADSLPAVLRGACDPMQLVFAAGSVGEVERIYESSPICRHFNEAAGEILTQAVSRIQGRSARILEIGAGTGATTAWVLPALAGQDTAYTFTDLSPVFLAKARKKFEAYRNVEYKLLNIEHDPTEQGFEAGGFDIIVAANVLHATANLRDTVAHARRLLRPSGMLLVIEGIRPERWLDLTLGLTDGWWRFADTDLRPEHPLVSVESWQQIFREHGMDKSRALQYAECGGELSQQVLLAACANSAAEAATAAAKRRWMIVADRSGVGDALRNVVLRRPVKCEWIDSEAGGGNPEELPPSVADQGDEELQVVYLRTLDAKEAEQGMDLCARIPVRLIQTLSAQNPGAKLWLITRGAQPVDGMCTPKGALQAMAWGIGRVLGLEKPAMLGRLIDLDPNETPVECAEAIFREVVHRDAEDQIAFRRGERLAPRLRHLASETLGRDQARIRRDGSYLIMGAFGNVGRRVTRWLAESGAGHLVLLSRNGIGTGDSPQAEERTRFVRELEGLGTKVTAIAGDVAEADAVERALKLFEGECPPLRGVLHMATSQKTTDLLKLTDLELAEVLRPKVLGSWLLAHAVRAHHPDFFISFSSTAALLGAQNMAAYAASNQFLDSFAAAQHAQGFPMISVNWGAWSASAATAQLRQVGLLQMAEADALSYLSRILVAGRPQVVVADFDWKTYKGLYESRRAHPIVSEVGMTAAAPASATAGRAKKGVAGETGAREATSLVELVLAESARVLGFRADDRPPVDVPMTDMGMDSLMAVDLRNRLQTALGRELPSTLVFDYPTVSKLAAALETMVWASAAGAFSDDGKEQDEVRI